MKTKEQLKKLKDECRDRIVSIREQIKSKAIDKSLGKSREQRESKEIEYLDSIIALLDYGYTEPKLLEWRSQLQDKVDLIKLRNPEPTQWDTEETLKKKIQEHEKAYGKSKLLTQINNIDFILN